MLEQMSNFWMVRWLFGF